MTQLVPGIEPESLYAYDGARLTASTIFLIPLQIAFVAARFYSRHLIKAEYVADNVLCAISLATQMVMVGLAIGSVFHGGVGHHAQVLTPGTVETYDKYLVAISVLYFATVNIPKFAILCLYRHLFPQRPVHTAIYVIGSVMLCQTVGTTVAALAACRPFAANWDPTLLGPPTNGVCIDKEALYVWGSFPGILTDAAILVLPIPVVLKLKMNMRTKASLVICFLLGSFGLVTSCLRFRQFYINNAFTDPTWAAVELIIWTEVEVGTYLISGCSITLKPLMERIRKTAFVRKARAAMGLESITHGSGKQHEYGSGGGSYTLRSAAPGAGFTKLSDDTVTNTEEELGHGGGIMVTTRISRTSADAGRRQSHV